MKEVIDLQSYLTASGSYPDRAKSPEITPELLQNAKNLLKKVNALLNDLDITKAHVTSGFRPSAVNASTKGAAKKSHHTTMNAIDIADDKAQTLANKLMKDAEDNKANSLLAKHGLYMEHPQHTLGKNSGWLHLQQIAPGSKSLVFKLKA